MRLRYHPVPVLWNDVGVDASSRINDFGDAAPVVPGDDDRAPFGIKATDDADMPAAGACHDSDRADLRAGNARAVACIGAGEIAAALVAEPLQDEIYKRAAPQILAAGRIGAEIAPRLGNQRIGATAGAGR